MYMKFAHHIYRGLPEMILSYSVNLIFPEGAGLYRLFVEFEMVESPSVIVPSSYGVLWCTSKVEGKYYSNAQLFFVSGIKSPQYPVTLYYFVQGCYPY